MNLCQPKPVIIYQSCQSVQALPIVTSLLKLFTIFINESLPANASLYQFFQSVQVFPIFTSLQKLFTVFSNEYLPAYPSVYQPIFTSVCQCIFICLNQCLLMQWIFNSFYPCLPINHYYSVPMFL